MRTVLSVILIYCSLFGNNLENTLQTYNSQDMNRTISDIKLRNGLKANDNHDYKTAFHNRKVLEGIRYHHEKMDGSGYPLRMRGENIPYYARIIGICDIFDALTSRRSYKAPMTSFEALLLMKKTMQNHVDNTLLKKLIEMFR